MPATNYDKWSKFAADLCTDSEEEEANSFDKKFTEKKHKFLAVRPKAYIPGGKQKLCSEVLKPVATELGQACLLDGKWREYGRQANQKAGGASREVEQHEGFTVEKFVPGEKDDTAEQGLGDHPFGSTSSDTSCTISSSTTFTGFGWDAVLQERSAVGSTYLPGYNLASKETKLWKAWYDDCFLQNQTAENPAARSLIGSAALGVFVVACLDRKTGQPIDISIKDVADLVYKRGEGKDAEKIEMEIMQQREQQKKLEAMGMKMTQMGV
ncbi:unnamed protein product [Amoebophrya sp. A25]|nr:unnamed protein product [Amoebophrya sp. A25]|eukprot:GSA25T00018505001.1